MHLLVNSASADFMKTTQLLNSNKGNTATEFKITMQLLIPNKEKQLLILTWKDAPADEQCICWNLRKIQNREYVTVSLMR
ncbi:hypothetical protein F511_41048 [Dorcoceras hygrometricum]|uniref:Uncharacterized protein n=1 Tax=Dorcoceras hygrometricum TaxID=472368 RepID=A0A2Z7A245_9LAMI|nr:hypothetical protein F511_41048 [Dorcoceras hygrometricum]